MNSLKGKVNVALCEVCDNFTPRLYVEEFEQECCEYCYEAYGDCNQQLSVAQHTIELQRKEIK